MRKTFEDKDDLEHEDWCWDYDKIWDCTCGARLNMMQAQMKEEEREAEIENASTAGASLVRLPGENTTKNQ